MAFKSRMQASARLSKEDIVLQPSFEETSTPLTYSALLTKRQLGGKHLSHRRVTGTVQNVTTLWTARCFWIYPHMRIICIMIQPVDINTAN